MNRKESLFVDTVWQHYRTEGRHNLPWRKTTNPYRILVSEMMLQQTQVDRVLPKYKAFLKQFPTVQKLTVASLGDVLRAWQGLGYNRRAKYLHECAKVVVRDHGGRFPKTYESLVQLPGVGPYTAGAIMAFAYNQPVPIIETNIRTVYLHHFFKNKTNVTDTELSHVIVTTLDHENPREWYAALMDYGAYLKKVHGNSNVRSRHYTKQSKFKGSDREVRGAIIRTLQDKPYDRAALKRALSPLDPDKIDNQLSALMKENMIIEHNRRYRLPGSS